MYKDLLGNGILLRKGYHEERQTGTLGIAEDFSMMWGLLRGTFQIVLLIN